MTSAVPHGRRWLLLVLVSAALLPVLVDGTVLFVAVPVLIRELGASGSQVLWIVDIYPLLMTGLVLASGPLGDRFGQRATLSAGLAIFGLASVACAYAATPAWLVAGRGLLAVGGALIIPSSLAIVRQSFADPRERAVAIGVWGAVASGGAAVGPLVGGVLLEHFWWGAVFLVNLPLAAAVLALTLWLLPDARRRGLNRLPFLSPFLGVVGAISLAYALKTLAHGGELLEPAAALALGLPVLWLFVRRERRAAQPVFDFGLFAQPRFRVGVAAALLPMIVLVGLDLLLSQQLQFVLGLTPLEAGLVLLPASLAAFVAAPLGGLLLGRHGLRRVAVTALLLAAAGYLAIAVFLPEGNLRGDLYPVLAALALTGLGHGVVMTAASDAVMSGAPEDQAGRAAAIESVSYEVGAGFGIAGFGSLMALLYAGGLPADLPAAAGRSIGEALHLAESLAPAEGAALAVAAKDAYAQAFRDVTLLAAALMAGFAWLVGRALKESARAPRPSPSPT